MLTIAILIPLAVVIGHKTFDSFVKSSIICPHCQSDSISRVEKAPFQISGIEGRYFCENCKKTFSM